jgi:hypothetical protein
MVIEKRSRTTNRSFRDSFFLANPFSFFSILKTCYTSHYPPHFCHLSWHLGLSVVWQCEQPGQETRSAGWLDLLQWCRPGEALIIDAGQIDGEPVMKGANGGGPTWRANKQCDGEPTSNVMESQRPTMES